MVLMPSKMKYRKLQKGSMSGLAKNGFLVEFGEFGMQALNRGWVSAQEIEAARIAINKHFSRKGKLWIRVYPNKPTTKKPLETRMGKGKGGTHLWVAVVRPGNILFEVGDIPKELAKKALRLAAAKISLKTRFVERIEKI